MERWKSIKGFEDRYEVSDNGRVRSKDVTFKMHLGQQTRKGKVLKESKIKGGYKVVELSDGTRRHEGGKRHSSTVHRLVAGAFVDGWFEGATVDHLDFDPANNHFSNLEWVTQKVNNQRKIAAGRGNNLKGSKQPRAKLTEADIPLIFEMREAGMTYEKIGLKFLVSTTKIWQIIKGENWKHVKI